MIMVYLALCDNFINYDLKRYLNFISCDRRQCIQNLYSDSDRVQSLISELMLRIIIEEIFGKIKGYLHFIYNAYGKPALKDYSDISFNISHTKNAIALAVSNHEVGVDIENLFSADLQIAKRFFTNNELNYVFSADEHKTRCARFLQIWTRKEAYAKYLGTGLTCHLLRNYDVLEGQYEFETLILGDYISSVYKNSDIINVQKINPYHLFNYYNQYL